MRPDLANIFYHYTLFNHQESATEANLIIMIIKLYFCHGPNQASFLFSYFSHGKYKHKYYKR